MTILERTLRRMRITPVVALILASVLGLSACDGLMSPQSESAARLSLRMVDAPFPFELVDSANVTISRVDIQGEATGTTTVLDDTASFNLLDLQNGVSALLGELDVEPDTYTAVYMYVEEASIILTDGTTFDLQVPSDRIKVLVNKLVVTEGEDVTLTIDFDVSKSFVVQGNPNTPAGINGFLFKPTVVPAKVERRHQHHNDGTVELKGPLGAVGDGYVEITAIRYWFDENTYFDDVDPATLEAGMFIEIEYVQADDGSLVITKIEIEHDDEFDELEIEGTIDVVGDDYVEVGGARYWITDQTEFDDTSLEALEAGMSVEIEYEVGEDGSYIATEIEAEDDGFDDEEEEEDDDEEDEDDEVDEGEEEEDDA